MTVTYRHWLFPLKSEPGEYKLFVNKTRDTLLRRPLPVKKFIYLYRLFFFFSFYRPTQSVSLHRVYYISNIENGQHCSIPNERLENSELKLITFSQFPCTRVIVFRSVESYSAVRTSVKPAVVLDDDSVASNRIPVLYRRQKKK